MVKISISVYSSHGSIEVEDEVKFPQLEERLQELERMMNKAMDSLRIEKIIIRKVPE